MFGLFVCQASEVNKTVYFVLTSFCLPLLPLTVGPHIGRYCGQTSPGRVISYTGILSMTITTDNAIAREGFSANYTIRERSLPPGHEEDGEKLAGAGGTCQLVLARTRGVFFTSHIYSEKTFLHFKFVPLSICLRYAGTLRAATTVLIFDLGAGRKAELLPQGLSTQESTSDSCSHLRSQFVHEEENKRLRECFHFSFQNSWQQIFINWLQMTETRN